MTSAIGAARFGDEHRPWLSELEAVGPPPRGLPLPDVADAHAILARLGVSADDAADLVAAWPARAQNPELWWLLERTYHVLLRDLGGFDYLRWPDLPDAYGTTGRYFYAYVFLAILGELHDWHARRGVPVDIATATLADLGRNLRRDRRLFGKGGLRTHAWLTLHFRGAIYELGRLQFNRMRLRSAHVAEDASGALREGDPALGIHIPEGGPLSPDVCDDSFGRAAEFFARYFPETPTRVGVCTSWLLDEQLAEYLDAGSNILRFQRRFKLAGGSEGDEDIVRFVFGRVGPIDLDALPQRTTLERAIVSHLRAGRHWRSRTGWLEL